jgi:hypothetical protein
MMTLCRFLQNVKLHKSLLQYRNRPEQQYIFVLLVQTDIIGSKELLDPVGQKYPPKGEERFLAGHCYLCSTTKFMRKL